MFGSVGFFVGLPFLGKGTPPEDDRGDTGRVEVDLGSHRWKSEEVGQQKNLKGTCMTMLLRNIMTSQLFAVFNGEVHTSKAGKLGCCGLDALPPYADDPRRVDG